MNKELDIRVAMIIQNGDDILLVQENAEIVKGKWNWVQGKVEAGESLADALLREVREETGLETKIGEKITVLNEPFDGTSEIHVFLGSVVGGYLSTNEEETQQAKWVPLQQLSSFEGMFTGPWVLETIESLSNA